MSSIYGFGNALIDIEIKVSEEQLKNINILKGCMKHISVDELDFYLDRFSNQLYSALPGGSIANSIYAANHHNIKTHFSCSIGDDEYGESFINASKNIFSSVSFSKSDLPTGICIIFITPDGQRTMAANLGANIDLNPSCIDIDKLQSSEYLLFDNYSLSTENGYQTAKFCVARSPSSKVCFGLSDVTLIIENKSRLKELFNSKIEILFGNEDEVAALNNSQLVNPLNLLTTLGERGAKYNKTSLEAPKIKIINSNGAGDALIGTFLANRVKRLSTYDSLNKAIEYASNVCCTNGPRLR